MNAMRSFAVCHGQRLVQLCSSGMDSLLLTSVALEYGNELCPLFIDFGFPWEEAEFAALNRIHTRINNPRLHPAVRLSLTGRELLTENSWIYSSEVPQWENGILTNMIVGRNSCLITLAHSFAIARDIKHIVIGFTSHSYPDAQPGYLTALMEALNVGMNSQVELHFPMPTADLALIRQFVAYHSEIPWDESLSCYRPTTTSRCGNCYKCTEVTLRRRAWGIG
jgi:7-cyano-7-deazaguanine synthase in queuosine biosynthesis